MRIMISGGGTGGHISPALAIIEELRRRDPQLLVQWVGRRGGMEERTCQRQEIPFRGLPVSGWPRGSGRAPGTLLRRAWVGAKLLYCGVRCLTLLKAFRPQVVIGVGGYVSLPLLYVAQRLGIPTMLHEQNKRLGMANRLLAPRATRIFLSYEDTIGAYPPERARVVGNPVRLGFLSPPERAAAREAAGVAQETPLVLVVGGSQGAHRLNAAMEALLPELEPGEMQVLWMTGKADLARAQQAVKATSGDWAEAVAYIEDMPTACAAADLVVARAGASSTAELAAMGKPSVLVPYPHATDDHQTQNAQAFEAAGAAVLLPDAECTGEALLAILRNCFKDSGRLEAMGAAARSLGKPLAAEAIVEAVMLLVFDAGESAASD